VGAHLLYAPLMVRAGSGTGSVVMPLIDGGLAGSFCVRMKDNWRRKCFKMFLKVKLASSVGMCIYIHVYTYIYIYVHVYIYIYIRTGQSQY